MWVATQPRRQRGKTDGDPEFADKKRTIFSPSLFPLSFRVPAPRIQDSFKISILLNGINMTGICLGKEFSPLTFLCFASDELLDCCLSPVAAAAVAAAAAAVVVVAAAAGVLSRGFPGGCGTGREKPIIWKKYSFL